jgi:hypothetical protein
MRAVADQRVRAVVQRGRCCSPQRSPYFEGAVLLSSTPRYLKLLNHAQHVVTRLDAHVYALGLDDLDVGDLGCTDFTGGFRFDDDGCIHDVACVAVLDDLGTIDDFGCTTSSAT